MVAEVDHMEANGSTLSMRQRHPVATVLAWLFGAIALLLSGFYVFMIVTVISEWSGYVGHESSTAAAILALFGAVTLFAWGATAFVVIAARRDQ